MNAVTSASGRLQAGEKNRPPGLSHPTRLGGNKRPSFTASKCWGDLWCRQFGSGPLKRREPWPSRWWRALPSVCKNHNIREAQRSEAAEGAPSMQRGRRGGTGAGWKDRAETRLPGPREAQSDRGGIGGGGDLHVVLRRHASLSGEARGQSCVFRRWLWPSGGEGQGNPVKRENSAGPARSTGEEGGGREGRRQEVRAGPPVGKGPGRGKNHFSFPF